MTTYFTVDGTEDIADWSGTGALVTRYVNGTATDDHVAMLDYTCGTPPCKTYYHPDWHGSTMLLSGATNSLAGTYHYGAYGESQDATSGNPFRYTGRRLDGETGLYYYRARYYSPTLGRFLQTDPIGSKDDLDLYAYTANDPLNKTDPTGNDGEGALLTLTPLLALPPVMAVAATAAAAGGVYAAGNAVINGVSPLPGLSDKLSDGMTAIASAMKSDTKPGAANGPTAGQKMPDKVKEQAADEAKDSEGQTHCQKCGVETGSGAGQLPGNTDHIVPASKGGDATIENAQHTCETCNKSAQANDEPKTTGAEKIRAQQQNP